MITPAQYELLPDDEKIIARLNDNVISQDAIKWANALAVFKTCTCDRSATMEEYERAEQLLRDWRTSNGS